MKKERPNPVLLVALLGLFAVACSSASQSVPDSPDLEVEAVGQAQQATPYVLHWHEGEIRSDSQGRTISITVSPATGSTDLSFWTTEIPPGGRILVHRHDRTEEILFVHKGSGTVLVGDERINVQEGSTIYVPRGTYHGLENESDDDIVIAFVATPPDLVNFIRGLGWPAGEQPRLLTDEEMKDLEDRYDSKLPSR